MDNSNEIKKDIEQIKRDETKLVEDVERLLHDEQIGGPPKKKKYLFFLDGAQHETDSSSISGADVRAKLSPEKAGYAIYLESHGKDPDKQVSDAEAFSLEKMPLRFYSVPPANFGMS
ncbi:MAG: hypothetical protein JWO95_3340 [Verrucomicrobiales bacterium]|nr:hypothetical protein [Verrucomicrobiales bacterium]